MGRGEDYIIRNSYNANSIGLTLPTMYGNTHLGTGEYDAILVVVDRYTKMGKFIPRGDINAAQFAALFHERIELNFGAPRGVTSSKVVSENISRVKSL